MSHSLLYFDDLPRTTRAKDLESAPKRRDASRRPLPERAPRPTPAGTPIARDEVDRERSSFLQ